MKLENASMPPVLQNPNYLSVDPFPLINVPNTPEARYDEKPGAVSITTIQQNTVINKEI